MSSIQIRVQSRAHALFFLLFGFMSTGILLYYLSNTIIHYTTSQQFPINSFARFPLTIIIFPAEIFSICFSIYFIYALITDRKRSPAPKPLEKKQAICVAVLLPVFNEPKDIVERTLKACKKVTWPGGVHLYLLDDSNEDADKKNMQDLAKKYDATLVRRENNKGYKAGNLNNAIKHHVTEEFFVILDSDQAPEPEFLMETMNHFSNPKVGFVQTPQYFINDSTPLERAVKIGTNIFYQTLCVSKARDGALPFCGTNAVTRTSAFRKVNGFSYYTATEDIDLGMRLNDAGYHGEYVPKILAKGYAPHDYKAYTSQQYRWANGNLAILRESWWKLLRSDYSVRYLFHSFFTLGWWLIGLITLAYIFVPLLSFFFGGTHHTWLPTWMLLATYPYVVVGIMMVFVSLHNRTDEKVTVKDAFLQYSLLTNSMFIYARAAINAVLGRYIGFVRTSKQREQTGIGLIKWNLMLSAVCFGFSLYAIYHAAIAADIIQFRTYLPISLWLLFYSIILASSILFIGRQNA